MGRQELNFRPNLILSDLFITYYFKSRDAENRRVLDEKKSLFAFISNVYSNRIPINVRTEMLLEDLSGELTQKHQHILSLVVKESNRSIELGWLLLIRKHARKIEPAPLVDQGLVAVVAAFTSGQFH